MTKPKCVIFTTFTTGLSEYIAVKPLDSQDTNELLEKVKLACADFSQINKIDTEHSVVRVFMRHDAGIIHYRRLLTFLDIMFSGNGLNSYVEQMHRDAPFYHKGSGKTLRQDPLDPPGIWTEVASNKKFTLDTTQ